MTEKFYILCKNCYSDNIDMQVVISKDTVDLIEIQIECNDCGVLET